MYIRGLKIKCLLLKKKNIMKKVVALLTVILCWTSVHTQETRVTGEIMNPTGDSIRLFYFEGRNQVLLSSTALKDGKFKMKFELDSAKVMQLYDGNESAEIILHPEDDLNVFLNTKLFDETIVFSGTGSKINNLMNKLFLSNEVLNNDIADALENEEVTEEELITLVEQGHNDFIDIVKSFITAESTLNLKYKGLIESDSAIFRKKKENDCSAISIQKSGKKIT